MPCRIGITTNPDERRSHWEQKYPTLRNWKILKRCKTKSAAQAAENRLAEFYDCKAHPGGGDSRKIGWVVYKFDY